MFLFFSGKLGCVGSLIVSLAGTILLMLLIRACLGGLTW